MYSLYSSGSFFLSSIMVENSGLEICYWYGEYGNVSLLIAWLYAAGIELGSSLFLHNRAYMTSQAWACSVLCVRQAIWLAYDFGLPF